MIDLKELKSLREKILFGKSIFKITDGEMSALIELVSKIEYGQIIEPPCTIGTPLFELFIYPDVSMWRVQEGKCTMLQQKADKSWKVRFSYGRGDCHDITGDKFGKTIFTNKIEAETMLEKLKGRKTDE